MTALTPETLADTFAAKLREWLSPEQFAEMMKRNALPEYKDIGACASHDFCDANEAMAAAFLELAGRDILPDDDSGMTDADCALWGLAWQSASERHLTAKPPSAYRFHMVGKHSNEGA